MKKRSRIRIFIAAVITAIAVIYFTKNIPALSSNNIKTFNSNKDLMLNSNDSSVSAKSIASKPSEASEDDFQRLVKSRADANKQIFLSVFDSSYVDQALNLYLTSFVTLNIRNYVFVGSDANACQTLLQLRDSQGPKDNHLACIMHFDDKVGGKASEHGTLDFNRKSHYKTRIVLDALLCGLTAVIVDIDIVFFKNPLEYMTCSECDLEMQGGVYENNSGFYLARPTPAAIALHRKSLDYARTPSGDGRDVFRVMDQVALAKITRDMQSAKQILVKTLPADRFLIGKGYFERRGVMFTGDAACAECVIVHNTWMYTTAAKIYRFKETGLWQVDSGRYYSDDSRKYLAYENPVNFADPDATLKKETEALKAAFFIGYLLNRTVILPAFHCNSCITDSRPECGNTSKLCPLNRYFYIKSFDAQLSGRYREHVFLRHPLVPETIKNSQSTEALIEMEETRRHSLERGVDAKFLYTPRNLQHVTKKEIIDWFARMTYSVLRFHSLYGIFVGAFQELSVADSNFIRKELTSAFVPSDYQQTIKPRR